jgi:hypothetical protein
MKIKKKGNYFVAYRDEDDLNNSMLNDKILIGDSLGKVSIKTGKFIGNTACIKVLTDYWKEVVGSEDNLFEHAVLNQIESDLDETDYDALSEMLGSLIKLEPAKKILIEYLSDSAKENWLEGRTNCRY